MFKTTSAIRFAHTVETIIAIGFTYETILTHLQITIKYTGLENTELNVNIFLK